MTNPGFYTDLSRRERQIMDAVYRLGRATVQQVRADIPEPPSYSAVRAMMGKLEDKGYLGHAQEGPRYVYFPVHPEEEARASALRRVLRTFFEGSPSRAVAALLDLSGDELGQEELEELADLIDHARRRGR
ncbi:MAG TPA: BlaI/MecI/CopY family transcriptional regulator [Longimicrobiales bacterium]|nr:BlaI/MecI/CopY family transcriptional regulator [Longimicrobiales bacterium]